MTWKQMEYAKIKVDLSLEDPDNFAGIYPFKQKFK
jgi:hypothetical protein